MYVRIQVKELAIQEVVVAVKSWLFYDLYPPIIVSNWSAGTYISRK